jgi:two-component system sensor histidine kinase/response regulator
VSLSTDILGHNRSKFNPEKQTIDQLFVRFCIRDTGIGINEELKNNLFKLFQNNHNLGTCGIGYGLAVAKHTVEILGGSISMSSQTSLGSRFWFTIPISIENFVQRIIMPDRRLSVQNYTNQNTLGK